MMVRGPVHLHAVAQDLGASDLDTEKRSHGDGPSVVAGLAGGGAPFASTLQFVADCGEVSDPMVAAMIGFGGCERVGSRRSTVQRRSDLPYWNGAGRADRQTGRNGGQGQGQEEEGGSTPPSAPPIRSGSRRHATSRTDNPGAIACLHVLDLLEADPACLGQNSDIRLTRSDGVEAGKALEEHEDLERPHTGTGQKTFNLIFLEWAAESDEKLRRLTRNTR
jgi:hypothetical protein